MAVNDIYEIAVIYSNPNADGEMANVFHYRQTAYDTLSSDLDMLIDCMTFFQDDLEANYLPTLNSDFTLLRLDGFIVNKPLIGTSTFSSTAGGSSDEYLPLRSAPVATKTTGVRGRSFRGRSFLMPVAELDQNGGGFTGPAKAALQAIIDGWLQFENVTTTNIWKMTVFSATLSTPPTIFIDNIVQTYALRQVFGSIRGRQKVQ